MLGIWWRRLTPIGAIVGLTTGGLLATTAVIIAMVADVTRGWTGALLQQPAAWAVPFTFAVMVVVSLASPRAVPRDVGRVMVRLHAPEEVAAEINSLELAAVMDDRSPHGIDRSPSTADRTAT